MLDYYSTFRTAMREGKHSRTAKSTAVVLGIAQNFRVGVSFCADRPSDREAQKIRAGLACPDGEREPISGIVILRLLRKLIKADPADQNADKVPQMFL